MGSFKENREKRQAQRAQRERLGLNITALVKAALTVRSSDKWMDDAGVDAASILEEFIGQNKTVIAAETVSIDWDAILEWIEMLMPIIILILSLFLL